MLCQNLEDIEDDAYVTMKLFYYDERTPIEYHPPGFDSAEQETFDYDYDVKNPVPVKVGTVTTGFHSCKLSVQSVLCSINEGDACNGQKQVQEQVDSQLPTPSQDTENCVDKPTNDERDFEPSDVAEEVAKDEVEYEVTSEIPDMPASNQDKGHPKDVADKSVSENEEGDGNSTAQEATNDDDEHVETDITNETMSEDDASNRGNTAVETAVSSAKYTGT
ncbi:unnamed protein product [Soboliphyme baturini]|uniref:HORMA domain-containing protein n=1 Tax=Soboliphyme baturini TaxID=241478 RepID=A0A183I9V4_9BILA|nr:unnamed protein product [Soboliphyme baturini]